VSGGILIGTTTSLQGDITNNATLEFDQSTDGTFSDVISGTGSVAKFGMGTVTLSGTNTYSGGTTISEGTLSAAPTNLGSGTITINGGTLSTTTFDGTGNTFTSGGLVASDSVTNLPTIASGMTVDLTGDGSFATATTLDGGTLATADFNYTGGNLTFTSGTHQASGALSNVPDIQSGMTVDLSSGGSFATSTTLDGGNLTTAAFDGTNLTTNSGSLTASGSLTNLPSITSGVSVDISGGGSFGDATTLDGGTVASGAFDYSSGNLTFTTGAHELSGALTNLNTLGANQGIVLDSSSATWSPTGDIDAGSVTLDGNAKLNVADYDASNLTFTDGDLTVTGTLTGLDSLSNTSQDIILDGGIWSTSGDLNFGNFPDLSENVTLKNGATLSLHDYTGYTMNGDLTGSGGGTLAVSGTLTAGTFESFNDADLTIDLTPGGQMVNTVFGYTYIQSGHLIINDGTVGTEEGDYYFDPTNSSSASLTVKGTLSGTLRSESNLTLVLDGGSHSTTSTNINALASVVIQNNGSLGVAAYDADALTFTDGTLTATGALTNLPTIAANNTVDISGGGSFGDATTLDGGQVNVANFNLASDNLTFTSGTLDTAGTLTVGSDNSTETLSGVISGSGILTKSGSGTTTLSGTNTYSGGTTISGGTLTGTTTSLQGDITNNAALAFDQDTDGTFSDVISGSGSLTKSGTGSLSLSGTNTYSGGTTVASGTLSLGSDSAAGTGTITTTGSVIDYADGVTIANAIDLQSDTTQLQVTTGSSATQSGVIGETGGARPLEKIGDGTLALTGTNTYTGGTTISAGTLSGTNANFGSGTITIDGGTLATTDFDATNLAFTSGSLTTTGALTNLNALTADQTVELNGGYWSPSGNIDAGDVILHNTGQLTVGDYDATNLAGVSGDHSNPASTLTTTGTLTNVNHAADLNIDVVLDGGTWADSTLTNGLAITIQNGGSLTTPADYDASLLTFTNGTLNTSGALTNLNSQSTGTGIVLDGGSWSPTGDIDDGSLTLQNAAALTIGDYDASNLTFTSGSITTDGALTNLNTLNANHTVTIDGASATWSPTDNIDAGTVNLTEGSLTLNTSFDAANLTFASTFSEPVALLTMNSGTLTNLNTLQVGQRVTLNGSSSWAPTGNIEAGETVLNSASATLTTTGDLDTRVVTFNAGTLAGDGVLSELPTIGSNMTVDLSSGGSLGTATTLDGGDLITADFDATLLTSTRGDLTASGAVSNLGTIGTNLNVDLTGGGSLPTATSLSGGNLRVADFDATQLSLSSGTLLATGDVSNLADIGSNLFVLMSSSAAFDTATTLDGGTVAISGSPGIYDFSANNLTFSSGTVSFFETNVANMPDITSGQIVELESTGFATTATLNGGEVELVDGIYDFNDLNFTFTAGTLTLSEAGLANLPAITTNQTVDITEGGFITTTFLAGGTLITDNFDEDDDVLFAFGTLQAYGAVHDLGSIINGQIVDISNGGSIEDLTTLDGGTLRVDDIDFDDEPVIFNAGTVVALGNVYLEDDLESGMILDITAGGELGGGADIIGGTLKTVDFDADGPSPTDFYEGTLSVTGELTNLDRLYGPDEGDGQTVILDGGTWSPDRGESDSDYINEGNVTIQNDGLLIVNGNYDATNLTFTHGTLTLTNEAELENLNTLGAGQTVVLDDAFWMAEGDINAGNIEMTNGSFLVANSGGGASTEFDATNLTFTSGGLAVEDQDLVNLNTVGTNQSVYLDNGSWAPSGSIDNADEIGLYNDASLTVGDYDASNLDFDSGTVTTTGSLTNLDTLGADNAVVIDGGEWLPTGGDISAGSVTVQNDGLLGVGTDFSTGTYDATNLTLTSGTLSSNHDITNLDTLGTGATVELLAEADWSPAGNIEAGTVKLNGGTLNVGDYDATNLPLSFDGADAGGTLVTTGTLTHLDSLTATLNVTLDGGTWNTTGDIDAGAVTVQNDGNLGVADYDATNLTLTAGTVTASGALTNLNTLSSSDQTVVLDGGSWSPTGSVGAGNVTLQNDGTLNVGDYDATRLTLSNGTVASDGSLTNLPTIAANTTIDLTLGGTLDSATTLDRGTINATELDATHLTFTSGTINVAGGPLTNLNTLGANQTVTLDNASWSTTGDIDNGHVTLTNNASLTVADYDTANLTFTSGTLEATGTLTHDQQLAANQTVRLNGTEATYDVGSDLQLSAGTVELTNGGTLSVGDHTATVLDAGTISFESGGGAIALDGGTLNLASLDGPFGLDADASITGNGSIFGNVNLGVGGTIDGDATGLEVFGHISGTGTLADLTLFGNIDIGNSPGDIYFENVDLSSESTIALAIEGPDLGQFDRLFVNASSDVSEATLQITFDSYTPASLALTFAIVSNDSGTDFASISTPEGWSLSNAGLLTYGASAVPEPGSFALLAGLATLGLAATRRRRSA
ncbi:autotransporter-associated beta strand repeat-containing protein, partial [Synoicihabitans lomoniglobus]